jgi:hypothetical protein
MPLPSRPAEDGRAISDHLQLWIQDRESILKDAAVTKLHSCDFHWERNRPGLDLPAIRFKVDFRRLGSMVNTDRSRGWRNPAGAR